MLSLIRVAGAVRHTPVLLTHGTFSNGQVCTRLAAYLAEHGYDGWVLELRGHGESQPGRGRVNFETWAALDVPAALEAVQRWTRRPELFLIGHSGGGLVFLMHLARHPEAQAPVKGLVTLASQATDASTTARGRATMVVFGLLNNLLGHTPGRLLRLGPEDEPRSVLNQWLGWNWRRRWVGRDGLDYLAALGHVRVPVLALAGAGDHVISPVRGCRRIHGALGSPDKRLVVCARAAGFVEDYGHARIIASRGARQEVWPRILAWLREHDR